MSLLFNAPIQSRGYFTSLFLCDVLDYTSHLAVAPFQIYSSISFPAFPVTRKYTLGYSSIPYSPDDLD